MEKTFTFCQRSIKVQCRPFCFISTLKPMAFQHLSFRIRCFGGISIQFWLSFVVRNADFRLGPDFDLTFDSDGIKNGDAGISLSFILLSACRRAQETNFLNPAIQLTFNFDPSHFLFTFFPAEIYSGHCRLFNTPRIHSINSLHNNNP